ncbi:MAG: long-chain-fatty-acid--CoA ligase [Methyloligellaceae bacterium]
MTTARQTTGAQKPSTSKQRPDKPEFAWLKTYPAGVKWDADFQPLPLGRMLDDTVNRYPDRTCTYFLGKTMTYSEIGILTDRAARGLQEMGVGKGTKVGLLLPNCPTYVVFFYAVLKAGGTVVNFNPLYTVEELIHQVEDSATEIMITLDLKVLFEKVDALLAEDRLPKAVVCSFSALLPSLKSMLFRLFKSGDVSKPQKSAQVSRITLETDVLANDGGVLEPDILPEEDVAVLQYTGGTTGTPKGAMLTHGNLTINVQQVEACATNLTRGEERIMGILPFFHVFGMTTVLNFSVATGSEMVLMPKFELVNALELINKTKPTVLPGVPTLYNAMMHYPELDAYDLSSLKFCISGGAALPIEVKRGFESLSGCKLVEGYGLSETSPVATCNPVDGPVKEGSIGIPVPQTVVSIRAIEESNKELAIGEDGEICIAGPQVMAGYWEKPDDTKDVFVGEFLKTGDVGHMDEDGFIFIVDRLKDMINCSGFKVYPRRIEEAIYEFPAVEEVTVVGIPDDYRGEAPKAFIKLREGQSATPDEIFAFLKPKISKLEMPSEIEFRDELPKTMVGKLSKKELRAESGSSTAQ